MGPKRAFINNKSYRSAFTVLMVHVHVRRHTTAVCSAVHRSLYWCDRNYWCTKVKVLRNGLWGGVPCWIVDRYERFGAASHLHLQGTESQPY